MKTSARNQFWGEVVQVQKGAVNAEVALSLTGGEQLTAVITNASVDELGLTAGSKACALIKASSVILTAAGDKIKTSARNQLCGQVARSGEGAVNGEVALQLASGLTLVAIVTNESIRSLGIKAGAEVCALIKASSILLAVSD
ncbi:MAG: TOBE domain-containing protein [Candidatus Competibacteraceae bacterium]|jgi:molybdate transport system regulatory protein|nr:TOBE domain-containing protein [Candidatus Competibacteraceae bacterium]